MKKAIVSILLMTALSMVAAQTGIQLESVRSDGMGGASVALADDAYGSATNPAGLFSADRMQFSTSYSKYFTGLNVGSLSEGNFFFAPLPGKKNAFALAGSYFMHDIFGQMKLTLSYSRKLAKIGNRGFWSLGVSGDAYRVGYNLNNALYDEDHGDTPDDPIFNNGTSKFAFGASVNSFVKMGHLNIGVKVADINEPNISLAGVEAGKVPRHALAGVVYDVRDVVVGAIDFDMPLRTATLQDPMRLSLGIEGRLFGKRLQLRSGYEMLMGDADASNVHLGLGFRSMTKHNIGFDYALIIPSGNLAENLHHKFGMIYGFPIPPQKIVDLAVFQDSLKHYPDIIRPAVGGKIDAVIGNLGADNAKKFHVKVYYFDKDSNYTLLERRKVDELKGNTSQNFSFDFKPAKPGYYTVYVAADDETEKEETRKSVLEEADVTNNVASFEVPAFGELSMDQAPRFLRNELKVNEISYVREEVPLMPFIFFDEGKSEVPQRFLETLDEYVARLKKNPNIAVVLRGFTDQPTEKDNRDLAQARATAVRTYLMSKGLGEGQVIVESTDKYDFVQPRAGKLNRDRNLSAEPLIAAENRRTEIDARIIGYSGDLEYTFEGFKPGETIAAGEKEQIDNFIKNVRDLVNKNEDITILFHAMGAPSEGETWENAFDRSVKARELAYQSADKWLQERMMVYGTTEDNKKGIKIILNGDAITYRPRASSKAAQGFQLSSAEQNGITLGAIVSDAGIDTYYVAVVDESNEEFRLLAAGSGFPPTQIPWNWQGNDGEPPEPNKQYFARVYLRDNVGQVLEMRSEPVSVNVIKEEKRQELVLINFTFGGTFSQSPFLEGRLEKIATDFIDKANQKKTSFKVVVGGHTDVIGTPEFNQELSQNRAEKENRNLRRMLMTLLKFGDTKELDSWLASNNVSMGTQGYGMDKPFVIKVWERGYFRDILIGNNEFPEGRFINRRVALEYEIIKKYQP